jgi:hypothetical protein
VRREHVPQPVAVRVPVSLIVPACHGQQSALAACS